MNMISEEEIMDCIIKISTLILKEEQKNKRDLYNFALKIENENQKLVGNSCPGRASTLLNYVNLDKTLMPYIAEQPTSLKKTYYLAFINCHRQLYFI